MRIIKKLIKCLIIFLFVILPILIFLTYASTAMINNSIASNVKDTLINTPLPDNSELCDSISVAGKISGNGNGMQFFGAILIKSSLPIEALDEYYSHYRENPWTYVVEPQSGADIAVNDHGGLSFSFLRTIENFNNYYIVYSWGESGYPLSDFDLRGH